VHQVSQYASPTSLGSLVNKHADAPTSTTMLYSFETVKWTHRNVVLVEDNVVGEAAGQRGI